MIIQCHCCVLFMKHRRIDAPNVVYIQPYKTLNLSIDPSCKGYLAKRKARVNLAKKFEASDKFDKIENHRNLNRVRGKLRPDVLQKRKGKLFQIAMYLHCWICFLSINFTYFRSSCRNGWIVLQCCHHTFIWRQFCIVSQSTVLPSLSLPSCFPLFTFPSLT